MDRRTRDLAKWSYETTIVLVYVILLNVMAFSNVSFALILNVSLFLCELSADFFGDFEAYDLLSPQLFVRL